MTGTDERQNVDGEAVELDRPAGDEGAARVQVAVVVQSVDAAGAAGRREGRRQDGAGVEPRDGGGVVLLVREELVRIAARLVHLVRLDHDLEVPIARQIGHDGRVDALGAHRRLAGPGSRILNLHRPAREQVPVAVPRIDVLVHRRDDDVEEAVAVEIGEHWRAEDAGLQVVRLRAERYRRERRIDAHREARRERTVVAEDVDVALDVRVDDLRVAVAVEVTDGGARGGGRRRRRDAPAREGGRTQMGGDVACHVGRHREARELRAVGAEGVDAPGRRRLHELHHVVAIEVDHVRRGLAAAVDEPVAVGVDRDRPARMLGRVVVHEEDLAVLAEVASWSGRRRETARVVVVPDAEADGEGELVRGDVRLPLHHRARGRSGEVGAGREGGHDVGQVQVREERPRAARRGGAVVEADVARARAHRELREARRLDADPELERPVERRGGAPVGRGSADDRHHERLVHAVVVQVGVEHLEPRRALEGRLGRDLGRDAERRHAEALEGGAQVDPAVAEVLVPARL